MLQIPNFASNNLLFHFMDGLQWWKVVDIDQAIIKIESLIDFMYENHDKGKCICQTVAMSKARRPSNRQRDLPTILQDPRWDDNKSDNKKLNDCHDYVEYKARVKKQMGPHMLRVARLQKNSLFEEPQWNGSWKKGTDALRVWKSNWIF